MIEKFVRSRVKGSQPLIQTLIREMSSWIDKGYMLEEIDLEEITREGDTSRTFRAKPK